MNCTSCGKQTPDNSKFCLHCGVQISSIDVGYASRVAAEWEYRDFIYTFKPGGMWAKIGSGAYTEAGAKLEFWQNYQQEIRLELQKWLDDGWEPLGEIGPASLKIRTYTSAKYEFFGWFIIIVLSIFMFLIPLLFIWGTYAEATEFRVTIRRTKGMLTMKNIISEARI